MLSNTTIPLKDKRLNLILAFFLILGLFLRLFHFFSNRSLWLDEGYLTSSLLKMNYFDLATKPLDYQQKAPFGFLWLVRFFINAFGKSEFVLRIVPLFSGISSMLFFIRVCKYFLSDIGALLAVAILCLSPALIYHSVEIKQYSTELFCTILSIFFFIKYGHKNDYKQKIIWGLIGGILLWFSYSAIFVLGGIGAGLTINCLINKNWNKLLINIIPLSMWLASFVINYFCFINKNVETSWVVYWFSFYNNFMPFPPKSLLDLNWFILNIYRMLDYPLGLLWNFMDFTSKPYLSQLFKMPILPILLLLAGVFSFFRYSKEIFLIILFPIILVCIASGMKLYPLTERFWVFICPFFILLIARGFEYFWMYSKIHFVKIGIFILLLVGPIVADALSISNYESFYVHKKSFQKEMFSFINSNLKKGDVVYIYWNELPGYRVYKDLYRYNFPAIEGIDYRFSSKNLTEYNKNLKNDFKVFSKYKRVWLIFNHKFLANIGDKINDPLWYYSFSTNPTINLENEFHQFGKPILRNEASDITICLFDLKPNQKKP